MRVVVQWLLCLVCVALWAPSVRAEGEDLVVERAWLEDPTGQLSWDEVRERPMAPLVGMFSGGYSESPVWLRLRIDPRPEQVGDAKQLYLRIRPMYLDEIVLFDPLQQPAQRRPVGDRHPVSAQAEPATTFLFSLPVGSGPRDVWLRVQTTSSRLVYADVFTPPQLRLSDARINHLGSLYLGLISVFFLWGLVQLLVKPEPLVYAILLNMGSWLLMGACFLGYAYLYLSAVLPTGAVDLATSVLILVTTGATLYFSHLVLSELKGVRWRSQLIYLLLSLPLLLVVVALAGHVRLALQINMGLILIGPIMIWVMGLMSQTDTGSGQATPRRRGLAKPVIVGYLTLTMVFTVLTALPALGLVPGIELSIYTVFFYSLSSGILMVLMLQYRAWQNMRLESEWRAIALEAKARAEQEQAHREEREHLLAMLGHELKTPLATMRMLLADRDVPQDMSQRFNAFVSEMTHVVDRVTQSGQLEAGQIRLHLEQGQLLEVIRSACREVRGAERVKVQVVTRSELWVETDLQLLKVVLRNLLDNALKYSPERSTVQLTVGSSDDGRQLWLRVCNAAGRAGVPDPERVFEKYYRNPKANHRSGSGLGLYLIQGLTRALGGQLVYEPDTDRVCFRLHLPTWSEEVSP